MIEFLLVALLGGLGAVVRALAGRFEGRLPWGILIANSVAAGVGAFALALPSALSLMSLTLLVGLAGGLSTFSTVIAHTSLFWRNRQWTRGWWNVLFNIAVPFTVAALIGFAAEALLK